jgi:glycosyltransferase involved in cell wall biosynthesis
MKIGFFADNSQLPSVDFTCPEKGSPGVGASLYIQAAVPYFIKKYCPDKAEVVIFAPHATKFPEGIKSVQADSLKTAAQLAKDEGVDYFVFRARQRDSDGILDFIDSISLPSVGVGQLTPTPETVRKMSQTNFFKALVCVGREQYDFLIDSPIKPKLAYIDNAVHLESCQGDIVRSEGKDPKLVVYMGALVPVKGFHVLAEAWPKILERVPDAKLSVIGSVKIYGENLSVGPLGVASEQYEREGIIPFLCNEQGKLHPSVTFHGQMGKEKFEVMQRATIGVVNPTGDSETCCVSAVEMSGCKVAVVSGAYYALLDTVLHKKTGLLGRGVDDLVENICSCLTNLDMAETLGQAGYQRVKNQYAFSAVVLRWVELFEALDEGRVPRVFGRLRNIRYHYKALRIVNSFLQQSIGKIVYWPSVYEAQAMVYKQIMKLKSLKG